MGKNSVGVLLVFMGLLGRVCVCVYSNWQPACESCKQGMCVRTPASNLFVGLVGRVCVLLS